MAKAKTEPTNETPPPPPPPAPALVRVRALRLIHEDGVGSVPKGEDFDTTEERAAALGRKVERILPAEAPQD